MEIKKLKDFMGQNLNGFTPTIMFAVGVSEDSKEYSYQELYSDKSLAEVVAAQKKDSFFSNLKEVTVLTNGDTVILLNNEEGLKLIDERNKLANVKARALGKLLPEERRLFKLPSPEELVSKD